MYNERMLHHLSATSWFEINIISILIKEKRTHQLPSPIDCEQSLFFFRFSESNARARSGEAARRAKRVAISHARGHLPVSRFARQNPGKRETARSLLLLTFYATALINNEFLLAVIVIYDSVR